MDDPRDMLAHQARRIVRQRLESLQRAGVEQIRKPPKFAPPPPSLPTTIAPATTNRPPQPTRTAPTSVTPAPSPASLPSPPRAPQPSPPEENMPRSKSPAAGKLPVTKAERIAALDELRCEVAKCKLCPALAPTRTQTVFGVGNPQPTVLFFGEAPGADEDAQGEPFVGRAGQLLNKIIEACTWQREEVFILNVLKCRPPNNRPPEEQEIANCRPFFERQLEILRPKYIVCLGASAAKSLLKTDQSIGKLRGKFHAYGDAKVLATYHPAYLLRNPAAKADVWEDMKMLLRDMGIELPKKGA